MLITTPFHPGYLTRDLVERVRHLPYTQRDLIRELAELTCTGIDPAGKESQDMYHRRCRLRPHRSQRCCGSQDPGIGGMPDDAGGSDDILGLHSFLPQVSGSNVVSVAEHAVMSILLLVRNFVPAHEVRPTPQSGDCAERK